MESEQIQISMTMPGWLGWAVLILAGIFIVFQIIEIIQNWRLLRYKRKLIEIGEREPHSFSSPFDTSEIDTGEVEVIHYPEEADK